MLNGDMAMVFNAPFNNISAISRRSALMLEETGVPGENHWPIASHWQILSHNVVLSTPRLCRIRTHNFSGDRHCIGSNKSNYYAITTTSTSKKKHLIFNLIHTLHIVITCNTKWKTKKIPHLQNIQKSNQKIVETEAKLKPLTHK
jgi:hypothetical protein